MANISGPRLLELERCEERLKEMMVMESITPFAKVFVEMVGVVLATLPYEEWPKEAKAAFQYARKGAETAARLYLMRLPKPSVPV